MPWSDPIGRSGRRCSLGPAAATANAGRRARRGRGRSLRRPRRGRRRSSRAARSSTAPARPGGGPTWRSGATGSSRSARSRSSPGRGSSTPRGWSSRPGSSTCTPTPTRGSPGRGPGLNRNYLTQGVTTIVTGNCGGGALDVAKYFAAIDAHGAGTNVIHLIPHGDGPRGGPGQRRPQRRRPAELERMKALVERGMKAGAWGMSTGLIYVPGRYARHRRADRAGEGRRAGTGGSTPATSATRAPGCSRSIDEAIAIGKGAGLPVHISHLKASGKANWGTVRAALRRGSTAARAAGQVVTADQYPYIASSTQLAAMVVPALGAAGDGRRVRPDRRRPGRRAPSSAREIQRELDRPRRRRVDPDRPLRADARPASAATWSTIAREEGTTPLDVVLDIQRHGGAQAISFGMSEDDVREVMRHDFVATASDGSTHLPGGGDQPHPRAYGTFPRKIRYALDEKVDHARAGDPLVLGPARRDPRPARPRRDPRRRVRRPRRLRPGDLPRRRHVRRPDPVRPGRRLPVRQRRRRDRRAGKPGTKAAARPGLAAATRTAPPT